MVTGIKWCSKRLLLVVTVWVWMFVGSVITIILIAYLRGVALVYEQLVSMLSKEPYLAIYGEVVGVGGLPLLISIICRDNLGMYGLRRGGIGKSLLLSVPPATAVLLLRVAHGDVPLNSFNLSFPYNIWYAILGVLAYGPLEVFFVIWIIANTDVILNSLDKLLSPGLIITTLAFGLSHIILSPQGGILNAVEVVVIFTLLGLIYKYTKNSIGPMIAWSLINGQVLHLTIGCLT